MRGTTRGRKALKGKADPAGTIRDILRRTPFYDSLRAWRLQRLHRAWVRSGSPDPPSHVYKQSVVAEYARRHGLNVLVETGTYLGDMIYAMLGVFAEIRSIELNPKFYEIARKRFARHPHVTIVHGDSGEVLGEALSSVGKPCLFWLDGHYTAGKYAIRPDRETPIEKELRHIADHPLKSSHVILIDDARDYRGAGDYPSLDTLKLWAEREGFARFEVERDIVRISNEVR
jgi:hypothetical protein